MLAVVEAVFLSSQNGVFEDKENGKKINYKTVTLGAPDTAHQGQFIKMSSILDFDTSELVPYNTYLFQVDIPNIITDGNIHKAFSKYKCLGIVPFDKK